MLTKITSLAGLGVAALLLGTSLPHGAYAAVEGANASYVDAAQKLIEKGDYRGAEIQLRNAVRANPDDADLHAQLADVYLKLANPAAAEAEAHEAQRLHGNDDVVAPALAQALLQQNKITQLLQQLQPGDRDPKAESTVRLSLGLAHLALRETTEGEPLLQDAARLDPDAWGPKAALARLDMAKGDTDGAKQLLDQALAAAPDSIEVLRLRGELLRATGDTDGAIASFDKILTKRPDDLPTLTSRANLYITLNKTTEAQADVDHALKLLPNNISAIYLNALLRAKAGDLNKADDLLSKIAANFPNMPSGYYLQGSVKYALGQYEQAEASLTKYMARSPKQPGVRRLLAAIALRKNDPANAIAVLGPVVAADPGDSASVNLLARAYVAAGRKDDAVALYERAAEATPGAASEVSAALMRIRFGNADEGVSELEKIAGTDKGADIATPLLVLGQLQGGEVAKASTTAEALVAREPDDPVALNLLGSVRVAQDRLDDARVLYEKLLTKDPQFLSAQRNLAGVYVAQKRPDDARKVLLDVLAKRPEDESAQLLLAQIAAGQNDMADAVKRLKAAQAAAPKDPTPGLQLIRVYGSQKDWGNALKTGQELEVQFPFNPRIVDATASVRAQSGDQKGAASEFRTLTQHYPNAAPLAARYAFYQLQAGDKEGARASLKQAVDLAPTETRYFSDLVSFDFDQKGPDAAIETARGIAAKDPAEADLLAAQVMLRAKRSADAIALLTAAKQQHPNGPITIALAEMTYGAGNHDGGKDMLASWLKEHPDDSDAEIALANLELGERHYDAAQAGLEHVRARQPQNVVVLNNLSWIYSQKHDPRAQDLARQAYRLAPSPQTGDTLGWALVSGGDGAAALKYLKDAEAALPKDATIQYHLAVALSASGDKAGARTVLEQLLKDNLIFGDRDEATRLLDQLQRG